MKRKRKKGERKRGSKRVNKCKIGTLRQKKAWY
jgi:hypothetical protein